MLDKIEGPAMRMILGGVLIFRSFYFSFFKKKLQRHIRPTAGWLLGTGSVSGVMYVLD